MLRRRCRKRYSREPGCLTANSRCSTMGSAFREGRQTPRGGVIEPCPGPLLLEDTCLAVGLRKLVPARHARKRHPGYDTDDVQLVPVRHARKATVFRFLSLVMACARAAAGWTLRHSRRVSSFPHSPPPFPHPPTSISHPPTSFPHSPTSFPRRRESPVARFDAPLGVAVPKPSCLGRTEPQIPFD